MKHAADHATALKRLLKKIAPRKAAAPSDAPPEPLKVLVESFLLWESTSEKAAAAYKRLMDHCVDFNDLRVCMPHETVNLLGARYPRREERCNRLRAALNDIYRREHAVNLSRLVEMGKRDARKYIDSLEGMSPYIATRVTLLCYDVHGIPVDDQLRDALVAAGVAEPGMDSNELSSWLSRHVKAGDGAIVHAALQQWMERAAGRRGGDAKLRKTARRSSAKSKAAPLRSKPGARRPRKKSTRAAR